MSKIIDNRTKVKLLSGIIWCEKLYNSYLLNDLLTIILFQKWHNEEEEFSSGRSQPCIHSPGREAGKKDVCPRSCRRSGETWSLIPQPRDKSVKEVVGLMSTARSLGVKDEAVLHLLSMSGIILGLPSWFMAGVFFPVYVHLEEQVNSLMLHGLEPQEGRGSGDEVNVFF